MNAIRRRTVFSLVAAMFVLLAGCASAPQQQQTSTELPTISDQTTKQKRASIRLQLATGYYERKQLDFALDELKKALTIYPDYAEAYGVRALIYMDMGELGLAKVNFDRALSLAPDNPDIGNNYGRYLCQIGREREALHYFELAFNNRKYREPSKALLNAGVCSMKFNDHPAAERYFLKAFKYDPSSPLTNGFLAKIYYGQKDYLRARFYINRVIQANVLKADVLWLATKIAHKTGDRVAKQIHIGQLQRFHPNSKEYAAAERGAFDE